MIETYFKGRKIDLVIKLLILWLQGLKSPDTPPTVRLNTTLPQASAPGEEVREELVAINSAVNQQQAPPTREEFTTVKTQGVREKDGRTEEVVESRKDKTDTPPLPDSAPGNTARSGVPHREDLIEVTTSFNTASPRPPSTVTRQLHNGYDK